MLDKNMELGIVPMEEFVPYLKKIKCVYYKKDGNTVVVHNKELVDLYALVKEDEVKDTYLEIIQYEYNKGLVVYHSIGPVAIKLFGASEFIKISDLVDAIKSSALYLGKNGYMNYIDDVIATGGYLNNRDVRALQEIGERTKAAEVQKYHDEYIQKHDEKENKERERHLEELRVQEEEKRIALEQQIEKTEKLLMSNNKVNNVRSCTGNTIMVEIMKRHSIDLPARTQGWMNENLIWVEFDKGVQGVAFGHKGKRASKVFPDYMFKLQDALRQCK